MIQPYDCIDADDAFVGGFGIEGITLYDSLPPPLYYFRSLHYLSETNIFT